eukprot:GHVR01178240.1.p1 GENE.GHVR01178240.1~~GHVR01178240.1.p1  ORF type:complete len:194 (+),score=21.60 GHVR01178240.1:601-1182(+)
MCRHLHGLEAQGERIDTDIIIILGHGIGGCLALQLSEFYGSRTESERTTPIQGTWGKFERVVARPRLCVAIAPVVDMVRGCVSYLYFFLASAEGIGEDGLACQEFMKCDVDNENDFPKYMTASPINRCLPSNVPQLFLTGGLDTVIPSSHATPYICKANSLVCDYIKDVTLNTYIWRKRHIIVSLIVIVLPSL